MLATMGYIIKPEITGKFPGYLSPSAGLKFADEKICRGSDEATRTCPNCQKQFRANTTTDTILQHRQQCLPKDEDGVPPPVSTMWKCPKCRSKCRSAFQREHEQHCRGSIKDNKTCSKCQASFQTMDARLKHEAFCRGSETLNNTCEFCKKVCKGFGSRVAHEKSCASRT